MNAVGGLENGLDLKQHQYHLMQREVQRKKDVLLERQICRFGEAARNHVTFYLHQMAQNMILSEPVD